jgi:hypothetical protein
MTPLSHLLPPLPELKHTCTADSGQSIEEGKTLMNKRRLEKPVCAPAAFMERQRRVAWTVPNRHRRSAHATDQRPARRTGRTRQDKGTTRRQPTVATVCVTASCASSQACAKGAINRAGCA